MTRRVQIGTEVKFVKVAGDSKHFGQVAGLETRFENERVFGNQKATVVDRGQPVGRARPRELKRV